MRLARRSAPIGHRRPSTPTANIPAFRAPSGSYPSMRARSRDLGRATPRSLDARRSPVPSPASRPARSRAARRAGPAPARDRRGSNRAGVRPGHRPAEDRRARYPVRHECPDPARSRMSPSANPGRPTAGTVQAPSATPMLARSPAAPRASTATSARLRPEAAAAPATLWMSTVPAMPRRRSRGTVPARATSSANHDDLDRNSLSARELGGEAEVQPVAGVVLDHQQRACGARGRAYGRQHGVNAGRGENITRHGGGEQAGPDITRMGGLMTRTAA